MGTSLNSIHIYGNLVPDKCGMDFISCSPGWLTCTVDFSEKEPGYSYKAAKMISKQIDAPVLHFGVFDSEKIWFDFFKKGKIVARYSDDEFISNKKIYDIPAMIGYAEGYKKRLSNILACSDTDLKIAMLEEYFGVCLLFFPGLMDEKETNYCNRTDRLYQAYQAEERELTGKRAPFALKLLEEYPGKLFSDVFGKHETFKPHFFLHGYVVEDLPAKCPKLMPVQFTGTRLETSDFDTFEKERIPTSYEKMQYEKQFEIQYGTLCKVRFLEKSPLEYRGKTMTLPNGFYPECFLPSGELLLLGNRRIYIADDTLKIIAKLSFKGDCVDILDNYILTTQGESFYAYCYHPKTKIYIYELVKKEKD